MTKRPKKIDPMRQDQVKERTVRKARFRQALEKTGHVSPQMLGVKEDTMRHWLDGRYVPPEAVMILMTFYKTLGPDAYKTVWNAHQRDATRYQKTAA